MTLTGWQSTCVLFTFWKWWWDQAAVSVHVFGLFSQTGFADIDTRSACSTVLLCSVWIHQRHKAVKRKKKNTHNSLPFPKPEHYQRKNDESQIPSEGIHRSNSHSVKSDGTRGCVPGNRSDNTTGWEIHSLQCVGTEFNSSINSLWIGTFSYLAKM